MGTGVGLGGVDYGEVYGVRFINEGWVLIKEGG